MSSIGRIHPASMREVAEYLGTETFVIHEDEAGEYVRIPQPSWRWMQMLIQEALFGDDAGSAWPGRGYRVALLRIGRPIRREWVNVGVLVYDNAAERRPLVAHRLTDDLPAALRRACVPETLTAEWLAACVREYATWGRVCRGGYPGSIMQVHASGASIRPAAGEVCDEFYRLMIAPDDDPGEGGGREEVGRE